MSHNIDKIFYINLEKRKDRREEIEKELNTFGLYYERFEAIETPGFGILGCGLSHLSVLKIAKTKVIKIF
jgi:GR25 family glycosyltransferase involved in LPS biosynthesis